LKHAFEQRGHDLALGVDAETEFASPASFAPQFDAWLEARVVLAARLNATERCPTRLRIAHDSCGVTAKQANAIDVAASQGGDISAYYYWWLDAPLYDRQDFLDFYEAIEWKRLSSHVFDHFAFLCWKLKARHWTVRDVSAPMKIDACIHGTDQSVTVRAQERVHGHRFIWCAATASGCLASGSMRLMRYHLDRRRGGLAVTVKRNYTCSAR